MDKSNFDIDKNVEYPTSNPTDAENEFNYLALQLTQAYAAYRRKEITKDELEIIEKEIMHQKQVLQALFVDNNIES